MHSVRENLRGSGLRFKPWRSVSRAAGAAALALVLIVPLTLLSTGAGAAQKQQNQKNSKNQKEPEITGIQSLITLPDAQAIELMTSQMLGSWQIGDVEMLKTFYADDVMVVSGMWEPPLQGWANYLSAYQAQRARTQAIRLDRRQTFIKVQGETAWCTYQWDFSAQVDGNQASAAAGHTTLVLQKRAGRWLIVLNHTSTAVVPQRLAPAAPAAAPGS